MMYQSNEIKRFTAAQDIARKAMRDLHDFIQPGISEKAIAEKGTALLLAHGSTSWWYHGIGAFVLLGKRSTLSISGKVYSPDAENLVAENDVITIDLAPTLNGFWGDYARTIFVENGKVVPEDQLTNPEFQQGLAAELHLHKRLTEVAKPEMTFEDLFFLLNEEITQIGYENLDFHGNLGHSVEVLESDRIYIEKGITTTFASCGKPFTFEPHIRCKGGDIGFKRENIYYFNADGALACI